MPPLDGSGLRDPEDGRLFDWQPREPTAFGLTALEVEAEIARLVSLGWTPSEARRAVVETE